MGLDASKEVGGGSARPRARDREASGGRRFDQECRYPSEQGRLGGLSPSYRLLRVEHPACCAGPCPTDGV